jgi:hypothetical protein
MPTVPIVRNAILNAIAMEGPMTSAELAEHLEIEKSRISGAIVIMRSYGTKFLRISSYQRQRGNGGREAPVYALGPGVDAPRPVMNSIEENRKRQARYREKHRMLIRLRTQQKRHGAVNPFSQLVKGTRDDRTRT